MKNKIKYATIGMFTMALCLISFIVVNMMNNNKDTKIPKTIISSEADHIELSFDEVVSQATHIIEAEYIGGFSSKSGSELMFKPVKLLKGEIDTDVESAIYVQPLSINSAQETGTYKTNGTYMLFLEKNSSVYYEHDKYVQLGELYVSSSDSKWDQYHAQIQTALTKFSDKAPLDYGVEYTISTDIKDVLQTSKNIFVVRIEGVYAKSTVTPTTVYSCSVIETLKNTPDNNGDILITLFNDTVDIGGEYIVLLADATETTPVYTLSSKNSVYSLKEGKVIPELEKLLKDGTKFKTIQDVKVDEDILAEEQEAANKN